MGSDKPTVKTISNFSPDQLTLHGDLVSFLNQQLGQGITLNTRVFPRASDLQSMALGQARQFVGGQSPFGPLRNSALAQRTAGMPAFMIDPAQREAYLNQAFIDPSMRDFERDVIPSIMEAANARGFGRSGFLNDRLARAGEDLSTNLAAQRAALIRQDTLDERQEAQAAAERQMRAIPLSMQQDLSRINVGLQTGAIDRAIKIQRRFENAAKEMLANPVFNPALGLLPFALTPTSTSYMQEGGGGSGWGGSIGSILGMVIGSLIMPGVGTAIGGALGGAAGSAIDS
jgi:hypothetical protein